MSDCPEDLETDTLSEMVIPVLGFIVAVTSVVFWREAALRALFIAIVILAPLRGGLLAVADSVGVADPSLSVNALVPALVAAFALGVLAVRQPSLSEFPRSLLVVWLLIAAVAVMNGLVQTVGREVYAIGLAQYLVYPTLALSGYLIMRPGDLYRAVCLVVGVGSAVALTVLIQAAGIESFVQSASAQVDGFAADRYAGITGSYLHTSAFLGVTTVLGLGLLLSGDSRRKALVIGATMTLTLSGIVLTFSRSGIMIFVIGVGLLFVFAAAGKRVVTVVVVVAAASVALAIGAWGGVTPNEAGDRVSSGLSPTGDAGNQLRGDAIEAGINEVSNLGPENVILGEGLARTGNAQELTGGDILTVESYPIKILVETGIIGLLVIGSILLWSFFVFVRALVRPVSPVVAAVGAAGVGLSLYNLIYPALETQLLALTWWTLLALSIRQEKDDA